jgi:hypothetical protein
MAFLALTDVTHWIGSYDASCATNRVEMDFTTQVLDATTFCSDGAREVAPGFTDTSFTFGGLDDDGAAIDAFLEGANGTAGNIVTVTVDGSDGTVGYTARRLKTRYGRGAPMGALSTVEGTAIGSSAEGLVRGQLLLPKQTVTGNVTGTGQQLGDVASGENLFASIHCFTAGTTASVIIESDDNSGFASATTRSTTVVTTTGATWVQVNPTITDTHWRVRVASVTGTFSLAVLAGIQ